MSGFWGAIPPSRFLTGNYTISTLPAAADYAQMYAWVTDLHDSQPDIVISDGANWKPVRPFATKIQTNANQNMTLTPLANSPTQIMQGTLTLNRNVTLSATNAYPGARFRIKREAGGALLTLLINGIGLGLNSWADMEFDGSTWVQTASGGLF